MDLQDKQFLPKCIPLSTKTKMRAKVRKCNTREGGSYLDLQYKLNNEED